MHTALPVPGIIASTDPHIILISLQPRILLIENFLSAADCQVKANRVMVVLCVTLSHISCALYLVADARVSRTSCLTTLAHMHAQALDLLIG